MQISNPNNMKDDVTIVFFQSLCKTRLRQPTVLNVCRLIAYPKFHKIRQFENHVTRNDVIMMLLPNTMGNVDLRETSQIIYQSKGLEETYKKCEFYQI